jgi:uncharacterized repeat protein (TIGR03803 family)
MMKIVPRGRRPDQTRDLGRLGKKERRMKSFKFGCGLALALLIPVGAYARVAETVLYSFTGHVDGSNPYSGLIEDDSGNFYGTTAEGGVHGFGAVFKLAPDGTEKVLSSFAGSDGSYPLGGLIMDAQGNLYGTTSDGGSGGDGTVFKVTSAGVRTVLHAFTGAPDGLDPNAALIMDKSGNFYGTTERGGSKGQGTVFEITPAGAETVLYSFDAAHGVYPAGALVMDEKGAFYSTTQEGGSTGCGGGGCGTVFKLALKNNSWRETVLHAFQGADGVFPQAGLIMDKSGDLYGTTTASSNGNGVVFKVTRGGEETTLWSFIATDDGAQPFAGLIMDKKGNLFGTTFAGGTGGLGTLFEIAADGKEKVVYSFNSDVNGVDGIEPFAGLIQDESGSLYGAAYGGGAHASGAIFKISKH